MKSDAYSATKQNMDHRENKGADGIPVIRCANGLLDLLFACPSRISLHLCFDFVSPSKKKNTESQIKLLITVVFIFSVYLCITIKAATINIEIFERTSMHSSLHSTCFFISREEIAELKRRKRAESKRDKAG